MRVSFGGAPRRALGGGCAVLLGVVFLAADLFFLLVTLKLAGEVLEERGWPEVPATIVSSSFDMEGGEEHPYRFQVRYRYRAGDGEHEGTVFQRGYSGSEDFRPVQLLLLRYPPGGSTTCRVNPDNPAQAVLRPRSRWHLLLVLAPLAFIAIGLAVLVSALRRRRSREAADPLRPTVGSGTRKRVQRVAGVVLILAGAGVTAALLPWMLGPIRARGWHRVPAEVVSSKVRRHESTDSDGHTSVTWKLDILYRYEIGGVTYHSNRYGFVGGSSSGSYGKRDIARRYPPGSRIRVWVDPSDPTRAVIQRGYGAAHLLGLVPLALLGLGIVLLRSGRRASRSTAAGLPVPEAQEGSFQVFEPGLRRVGKVGTFLFFCLFWNGIVSVFLWQVVQGFRHGHPSWFQAVFLTPFVLVGLVFVGLVIHSLLALANPRTTLTLLTVPVRLGAPLRIAWRTQGRVSRLRRMSIVLEGIERATYRRGTKTHTDTSTFRTLTLAQPEVASQMRTGEAEVEIPEDTMHTFRGQSNQILWKLKIQGEIPRWPDVADEWEIEILPLPTEGR